MQKPKVNTKKIAKVAKPFVRRVFKFFKKERNRKFVLPVILLLICILIPLGIFVYIKRDELAPIIQSTIQQGKVQGEDVKNEFYQVIRVVDGDTFKIDINGVEETIRLIGIDAPESVAPNSPVECFGIESSEYLKELIENRTIKLEIDESQENVDRYGRLLRYAFTDEKVNINLKMLLDGYAHEYTYRIPYKYQSEFKAAEDYAMQNDIGLWGAECI